MDHYTISALAQQHIDDLRRDASRRRLAQITRKHKKERTVEAQYGFGKPQPRSG